MAPDRGCVRAPNRYASFGVASSSFGTGAVDLKFLEPRAQLARNFTSKDRTKKVLAASIALIFEARMKAACSRLRTSASGRW
jgi:hypothetical protein